jgi:chromosome segregation ATPase
MSKKEHVTYQQFVEAVAELKRDGITPTVRAVKTRITGRSDTLTKYLRQWHHDQAMASVLEGEEISETLKDAFFAELNRKTKQLQERLDGIIKKEQQQNKETNELLTEAENKIEEMEAKTKECEEKALAEILTFEKKLSAANERVAEMQRQVANTNNKYEQQITVLQDKISHLQQENAQIKVQAAIAETKASELEKQLSQR